MSAVSQTVLRTPVCLRKERRSAISCSRRSGGPSPSAIASWLTMPIGRAAAITFQVAVEARQNALQPLRGGGPRKAGGFAGALVPAGIAIAAHIDHEDIEHRAVRNPAIDTAGVSSNFPDRHGLEKG